MDAFGERLRTLRERKSLSQDRLAEMTGISQNQISRYERGINDPTGKALIALARALETSADYLLGLAETPSGHVLRRPLSAEEIDILRSRAVEIVNRMLLDIASKGQITTEDMQSDELRRLSAAKTR